VEDSRETRLPARAREILKHYLENPAAADTLEGISEWRLLDAIVQRRVDETDAALRWLVAHGYLRRLEATGAAPPLYQLDTKKVGDAKQLVQRKDDD
jgi:hypothetical protein